MASIGFTAGEIGGGGGNGEAGGNEMEFAVRLVETGKEGLVGEFGEPTEFTGESFFFSRGGGGGGRGESGEKAIDLPKFKGAWLT